MQMEFEDIPVLLAPTLKLSSMIDYLENYNENLADYPNMVA